MGNLDSAVMEYAPELESFEFEDGEWAGEGEVFSEAELMELAGELLEVQSEAELDQFLGKLIKRVGRAVGRVVRSPIGRAVGGFLKGVAKRALPLAGTVRIPGHADHRFRLKPITHSDGCRSPVPMQGDHRFRRHADHFSARGRNQ